MATPESIPQRALGSVLDARSCVERDGPRQETVRALEDASDAVEEWLDWLDEIVYALRMGRRLPEPPSPWHERKRAELARKRQLVSERAA